MGGGYYVHLSENNLDYLKKIIIWVLCALASLCVSAPLLRDGCMDDQHYIGPSWTVFFCGSVHPPRRHGYEVPLAAVLV